jgi:hypothetical protein
LLTLIAVLFIGANIYKKGANRAACILNIRNIHQAVRADQNLTKRNVGDDLAVATIMGTADSYIEVSPSCPTDGIIYTLAPTYPATGTVAATCTNNGENGGTISDHLPEPGDTTGW